MQISNKSLKLIETLQKYPDHDDKNNTSANNATIKFSRIYIHLHGFYVYMATYW